MKVLGLKLKYAFTAAAAARHWEFICILKKTVKYL